VSQGTVYGEGRTIAVSGGTLTDSFARWGVHVYRLELSDTTPPAVQPPSDQTVRTTSADGVAVSYPACTASDPDHAGTSLALTYAPAPGSVFPVGDTTVTCTASDPAGNHGAATFVVHVIYDAPATALAVSPAPAAPQQSPAAGPARRPPRCLV